MPKGKRDLERPCKRWLDVGDGTGDVLPNPEQQKKKKKKRGCLQLIFLIFWKSFNIS